MNVIDLYIEDLAHTNPGTSLLSVSGGREFRGPCPVCGGKDRFGVWPDQNGGEGSWHCGRSAAGCKGCLKGGDTIEYLRHVRGMSFVGAKEYLGIKPSNRPSAKVPSLPRRIKVASVPDDKAHSEEVESPELWREKCEKFITACEAAILDRPSALFWLAARGIPEGAVRRYRIGFHAGNTIRGREYQPTFRPWSSWGLRKEMKKNGRERMLVLPAGIVFPYIAENGEIQRITIRMVAPDANNPHKKYHYVKGSRRTCWLDTSSARRFTLQEAELDAIAAAWATRNISPAVGHIALGTTGMKPDTATAEALSHASLIIGALDYDTPRVNTVTGEMESPGAAAGAWWEQNYPQYVRWPVPVGKDAGEAFALGVDLAAWIGAALEGESVVEEEQEIAEPLPPVQVFDCSSVTLKSGRVFYLTEDRDEWGEIAASGTAVFTENEMERLKTALSGTKDEVQIRQATDAVLDIKEVLGGYIRAGRSCMECKEVCGG